MNALVAQYSRPGPESHAFDDYENEELSTPSLSLKFALPPVAQVYISSTSKQICIGN